MLNRLDCPCNLSVVRTNKQIYTQTQLVKAWWILNGCFGFLLPIGQSSLQLNILSWVDSVRMQLGSTIRISATERKHWTPTRIQYHTPLFTNYNRPLGHFGFGCYYLEISMSVKYFLEIFWIRVLPLGYFTVDQVLFGDISDSGATTWIFQCRSIASWRSGNYRMLVHCWSTTWMGHCWPSESWRSSKYFGFGCYSLDISLLVKCFLEIFRIRSRSISWRSGNYRILVHCWSTTWIAHCWPSAPWRSGNYFHRGMYKKLYKAIVKC